MQTNIKDFPIDTYSVHGGYIEYARQLLQRLQNRCRMKVLAEKDGVTEIEMSLHYPDSDGIGQREYDMLENQRKIMLGIIKSKNTPDGTERFYRILDGSRVEIIKFANLTRELGFEGVYFDEELARQSIIAELEGAAKELRHLLYDSKEKLDEQIDAVADATSAQNRNIRKIIGCLQVEGGISQENAEILNDYIIYAMKKGSCPGDVAKINSIPLPNKWILHTFYLLKNQFTRRDSVTTSVMRELVRKVFVQIFDEYESDFTKTWKKKPAKYPDIVLETP